MIGANKKKSDFATPYTVSNALTKGGAAVKLSALIMGLGNIAHKQIIKGLIFFNLRLKSQVQVHKVGEKVQR